MDKEESILQNRLIELSNLAYQRDIVTFSNFLNLNELNILHTIKKEQLPCAFAPFGGYDLSERQMVAFLPDALCYEYKYPISIIKIIPVTKKYADALNHRDYLGAILNLGISRSKIGDLIIDHKEQICYAFVQEEIEDFIVNLLSKVKHTLVSCCVIPFEHFSYTPERKTIQGTVAGTRLDALIAFSFGLARNKCIPYIEGKRVFINGKMVCSNGARVKENDIISVRGLGKFQFISVNSETKKGRYHITVEKYI